MISAIEIRANLDVLDKIAAQMRKTPGLMETAYKRQVRNSRRRFLSELHSSEPPPPRYPLRWKSARQRRAYFATNGFGRGIPYRRTGDLINSYDLSVRATDDGGVLVLENDNPSAVYVIGDQQQPFHADTGWERISEAANRIQDGLTEDLINTWETVADPFAGVPI